MVVHAVCLDSLPSSLGMNLPHQNRHHHCASMGFIESLISNTTRSRSECAHVKRRNLRGFRPTGYGNWNAMVVSDPSLET